MTEEKIRSVSARINNTLKNGSNMTVKGGISSEAQSDAVERVGYFALLKEDYSVYKEKFLAQGFWALRIHRFSSMTRGIKYKPLRIIAKAVHRIMSKCSQVVFGIYIGANATIGRRCIIEHFGGIIIHSDARIGDDVIIRQGVTIGIKSTNAPEHAPVIGNRVDIGAGAKILGRIVIGDDVDIGANAVVITNVPPKSIAVGVPAVVKRREKK